MPEEAAEKKATRARTFYQLPDGNQITYKGVDAFYKNIIRDHHGTRPGEKGELVEIPDAYQPLGGKVLLPGSESPICAKCGLDQSGCRNPYVDYVGADHPVATIILETVSPREDDKGFIGAPGGRTAWMLAIIEQLKGVHGVSLSEIRWVPITRCSARDGEKHNYKTKGNWCRHFLIQDLMLHPPRVIIPVGTAVLGLLSHKSNANDWSGRLLTWRGWPDDWLTNPKFVKDRPDPLDEKKMIRGHPVFGPPPNIRIPMVPLQHPGIMMAQKNAVLADDWKKELAYALEIGKKNVGAPDYNRPWYWITTDKDQVIETLKRLIEYAQADPDFLIAYDTETTGLKQWPNFRRSRADEADPTSFKVIMSQQHQIVFMMFRWQNPQTGEPESIGFPWNYPTSALVAHLDEITPYVLMLLMTAKTAGHNLAFDHLFTIAGVGAMEGEFNPFNKDGSWNEAFLWLHERINRIAEAGWYDTWHMAFTALQRRGSLGLEVLAYSYADELAGYEEEMTLLIELEGDLLDPANEKGGHYAMCPPDKWETHLKPYVMGDVEVTYRSRESLSARLERTKAYKIPLAHTQYHGTFRYYLTPTRKWVYDNIMRPANQTLTKMMARGMYVDPEELERQEELYPNMVKEAKEKLRETEPMIDDWCVQMSEEAKKQNDQSGQPIEWELDLENKSVLKELLFQVLNCPILRLTKKGRELYGDDAEKWSHLSYDKQREYAAVDKYTLNRLCVDHPNLRPLQEYRKVYKLYTTYVRPMRNMLAAGLDKKKREKDPHLCIGFLIHAFFMLTGTRSGRLSSRDPNLQQLPLEGDVKRLFASRFGGYGCIYTADLSQIELRLMAGACGDESMINVYMRGDDIHSMTASKIYKLPYEHFTKGYMEGLQREGHAKEAKELELKRKIAKTTNFLTGYGGGAFGLQNVLANNEVYLGLEECEGIIESFFAAYPMLKRFLGVYKTFITEHANAVSMFGRVRQFDEIYSEDDEARSKALRAGCNHLIQSTASDMMLICLCTIEKLMRDSKLNSMLVSTVHDSLVIDAVRSELSEVHQIVNWVMNSIPSVVETAMPDYDTSWMYQVPFAGDSEVGLNYLEASKISGDKPDWEALLKPAGEHGS